VTLIRTIPTPLGDMLAAASEQGVHVLEFTEAKYAQAHLDAVAHRVPAGSVSTQPPLRAAQAGSARSADGILDTLTHELAAYFAGDAAPFTTPLAPLGTDFQRRVWHLLLTIPRGDTTTYSHLAGRLDHHHGKTTLTRAVAGANARNPIAILIPCHRVIGKGGSLTGYAAGLERKRALLELEGKSGLWGQPFRRLHLTPPAVSDRASSICSRRDAACCSG
jgi:O-6-methylguanine DNA methyltransferase